MQNRHTTILKFTLVSLLLLCWICCDLYVIVHYRHIWTVLLAFLFHVIAFTVQSVYYGFNIREEASELKGRSTMSDEEFLNRRDGCYAFGMILFIATYIIPAAAMYHSGGVSPPIGAVICEYTANTLIGVAFIAWAAATL